AQRFEQADQQIAWSGAIVPVLDDLKPAHHQHAVMVSVLQLDKRPGVWIIGDVGQQSIAVTFKRQATGGNSVGCPEPGELIESLVELGDDLMTGQSQFRRSRRSGRLLPV